MTKAMGILIPVLLLGVVPMAAGAAYWAALSLGSRAVRAVAIGTSLLMGVGVAVITVWEARYRHAVAGLYVGDSIAGVPFKPDRDELGEASDFESMMVGPPRVIRKVEWNNPVDGSVYEYEVDPRTERVTFRELSSGPSVRGIVAFEAGLAVAASVCVVCVWSGVAWLRWVRRRRTRR